MKDIESEINKIVNNKQPALLHVYKELLVLLQQRHVHNVHILNYLESKRKFIEPSNYFCNRISRYYSIIMLLVYKWTICFIPASIIHYGKIFMMFRKMAELHLYNVKQLRNISMQLSLTVVIVVDLKNHTTDELSYYIGVPKRTGNWKLFFKISLLLHNDFFLNFQFFSEHMVPRDFMDSYIWTSKRWIGNISMFFFHNVLPKKSSDSE